MTRNIYIDNIELEKALEIVRRNIVFIAKTEKISVKKSIGRIVAKSVFANRCSPSYTSSAMDGIFLFSEKIENATEVTPIFLKKEDFKYVNTGDPLDYNFGDSVIMIEEVIPQEDGTIKILKSAKPWQHIRAVGEDIVQGEMILKENHKINPQDLAAIISAGIKEIEVLKKPTVGIIPTGNEVVDIFIDEKIDMENKIVDSNSYMFSAMIEEWGGVPTILKKSQDEKEILKEKIREATNQFDIVIVNAGSSAGSKDFSKIVMEELGRVIIHGVAIKPGKPSIIGEVNEKLVLGIPGYPVSAYLSLEIFLKPFIEELTKVKKEEKYVEAELSKNIVSSLKFKEYLRVSLSFVGNKIIATPLSRGAGITMSLIKADGILEIPKNKEGISSGEKVRVRLLKSLEEVKESLVSIGSHDIIMEHIADKIKLVSTHTGSFGGILAIKNKSTHIAPIHILDETTGTYNIEIIKKYFKNQKMILIKGVRRTQGLIVEKGNPKKIFSIKDLTKDEVYFINRQRGAGTRILLDYFLKKEGIDEVMIKGYEREMFTHLEVAMAIKSKIANVGLGIKEAATIAGLDFIPIKDEEYDFLLNYEDLSNYNVEEFIKFLRSDYFVNMIKRMDGYSVIESGKIIEIN